MAKITVRGREYELRVSLWASEQIEEKYGDLKEALKKFRGDRRTQLRMVREMFTIMANAGQRHRKRPEDVTADVLDDCTMKDLNDVIVAMNLAMDETMHAETVGGNEADDEPRDALAEEYEEKNG